MTKTKSIGTKALSVVLSALMVFGMLAVLFAATPVKAEAATAGNYTIKVWFEISNTWDSDAKKTITISGKANNGTGSETTITTISTPKSAFNQSTYVCYEGTSDKFPTRVSASGSGSIFRSLSGTIKVSVNGTTLQNTGSVSLLVGSIKCSDWTANSADMPYAKTATITGDASVTAPHSNSASTDAKSYSVEVKDQYGVQVGCTPSWAVINDNWGGCSISASSGDSTSFTAPGKTEGTTATVTLRASGTLNSKTATADKVITVNATPHTSVTDSAVAATCTTTGKTEGAHCSVCSKVITAQTTTPVLGHNFTNYVYNNDATCLADGTETGTCSRCSLTNTRTKAGTQLSHSYTGTPQSNNNGTHKYLCVNGCNVYGAETTCSYQKTVKVAATCTAMGTSTYTCSVCSYSYDATDISMIAHNYVNYSYNNDATCLADGTETGACSACGKSNTRTKTGTKLGHSYTGAYMNNNNGTHSRLCVNGCNLYGDTTACTFNGGVVVTFPTCTAQGQTEYTCTACGYKKTLTDISANGHTTETIEATVSTCVTQGNNKYYHCTGCNLYFKDAACTTATTVDAETLPVNPDNHTGGTEIRNASGATCTQKGYTGDTHCASCGVKLTEGDDIPYRPHSYADGYVTITAATCTTDGLKTGTCVNCGYEDNVTINKLGHIGGTATCTEQKECTRCHEKYGEALGHAYTTVVTDPTCTEKGFTTYTCTRTGCGDVKTADYVNALGHTGGTANCVDKAVCTRCSASYGEVDAANHKNIVDDAAVPATCTATGLTAGKHCSACGVETVAQTVTPALGHTGGTANCVDKAVCTRCGKPYGDVDATNHKAIEDIAAVAATCTETGKTAGKRCSACGVITEAQTDTTALGHSKGAATIENNVVPDCTNEGGYDTVYYCTRCTVEIERQHTVVPANGHTAGAAADCTNPQTCTVCGTVLHAALGHDYGSSATCTSGGTCVRCGYVNTTAIGHSFTNYVYNNDAACETNGTETAKCDRCDATDTREAVDTKLGHTGGTANCKDKAVCDRCGASYGETDPDNHKNIVDDEAVAATCTDTGLTAGKHCAECGVTTVAQTVTPALGHTGGTANCKDKAVCSRCGASYGEVNPDNHKNIVDDEAVPATCTDTGLTAGKHCAECGVVTVAQTVTNALGHTGGTANCKDKAVCSRCGASYGEVNPANHKNIVTDDAVPATCLATGKTEGKHCAECGVVTVAQTVTNALGHSFTNYVYNDDATCTADGTKTAKCDRCDATDTKAADGTVLGHTGGTADCISKEVCERCFEEYGNIDSNNHANLVVDPAVPAGCLNQGMTEGSHCTACNKVVVKQRVTSPALGHDYQRVVTKEPTCIEIGSATTTCSRCDYSRTDVLSALGHKYVDHAAKPAGCTTIGWNSYRTCERCDYTNYVEIAAKGHTPGTPKQENNSGATCSTAGTYELVTYCSACNEELSRVLKDGEKLPHTPKDVDEIPATCSEYGYTAGTSCRICGAKITGQERIDKLPHTTKTIEGQAPDCTHEGYTDRVICTVCHAVVDAGNVIPAEGHSFGEWQVIRQATFNTDGLEGYTCTKCGESVTKVISMWTVYPRIVRFYPMNGIRYVVNDTVKVTSYKEIEHPVAYDLTFTIETTSGFSYEGFYVYLDGEKIEPNENGVYVVPGGSMDTQTVSVSGIVTVDDDNNLEDPFTPNTHKVSFWEWLMGIFRKIAALFAGKK